VEAELAQSACWVKGCGEYAPYTPVLNVVLRQEQHVSRVALPARLCPGHRADFPRLFLTAERRASMEEALRAKGRAAPDWARTTLAFSRG
jgi:hypothetical protein